MRGLVIGKFKVVHQGHVALIRFAAARCDELIVSMSYKEDDPIPVQTRLHWMKIIFESQAKLRIETVADDFDNEQLPLAERMVLWSDFIRSRYPKIDVVFSSEEYGEPFARNLGSRHIPFDPLRKQYPVSSTQVIGRPLTHWNFLPAAVRPYFVKKICFYGPESTGKTTMAKQVAALYHTDFVPEVSREMSTSNDFSVEDIIRIGRAQTDRVLEKVKAANKILICDTDLITTQIYSRYYLHQVPPVLFELEKQVGYDLYFFFDIDVPWVADGLRDLGGRREMMKGIFLGELEKRKISFVTISGSWDVRASAIKRTIDEFLARS